MSKIILHEKAIQLRLEGKTYGQIKRELGVSKSTLSDWLRMLPLNKNQQIALTKNKLLAKDISREKFIETFKQKRLLRLKAVLDSQTSELLPLTKKELFIAGILAGLWKALTLFPLYIIPTVLLRSWKWSVRRTGMRPEKLFTKHQGISQEIYGLDI